MHASWQAGELGVGGTSWPEGNRVSLTPEPPPAYRRADSGAWCCAPASSGLEAAAVCPALSFFHPYPSDPQHLWGQPVREGLAGLLVQTAFCTEDVQSLADISTACPPGSAPWV